MFLISTDKRTRDLLNHLQIWFPLHYNHSRFLDLCGDDPLLKGIAESMLMLCILNFVVTSFEKNKLLFVDPLVQSLHSYRKARAALNYTYQRLDSKSPLREIIWPLGGDNMFPVCYLGCIEFAKMKYSDQENLFRLLEALAALKKADRHLSEDRFDTFFSTRLAADPAKFTNEINEKWLSLRPIPITPGHRTVVLKSMEYEASRTTTPTRPSSLVLFSWSTSTLNEAAAPDIEKL